MENSRNKEIIIHTSRLDFFVANCKNIDEFDSQSFAEISVNNIKKGRNDFGILLNGIPSHQLWKDFRIPLFSIPCSNNLDYYKLDVIQKPAFKGFFTKRIFRFLFIDVEKLLTKEVSDEFTLWIATEIAEYNYCTLFFVTNLSPIYSDHENVFIKELLFNIKFYVNSNENIFHISTDHNIYYTTNVSKFFNFNNNELIVISCGNLGLVYNEDNDLFHSFSNYIPKISNTSPEFINNSVNISNHLDNLCVLNNKSQLSGYVQFGFFGTICGKSSEDRVIGEIDYVEVPKKLIANVIVGKMIRLLENFLQSSHITEVELKKLLEYSKYAKKTNLLDTYRTMKTNYDTIKNHRESRRSRNFAKSTSLLKHMFINKLINKLAFCNDFLYENTLYL